jgi:hypothetical protein
MLVHGVLERGQSMDGIVVDLQLLLPLLSAASDCGT